MDLDYFEFVSSVNHETFILSVGRFESRSNTKSWNTIIQIKKFYFIKQNKNDKFLCKFMNAEISLEIDSLFISHNSKYIMTWVFFRVKASVNISSELNEEDLQNFEYLHSKHIKYSQYNSLFLPVKSIQKFDVQIYYDQFEKYSFRKSKGNNTLKHSLRQDKFKNLCRMMSNFAKPKELHLNI